MERRIVNPEAYKDSAERKIKLREIVDQGDKAEVASEFLADYFKKAKDYYVDNLLNEKCDIQKEVACLRATFELEANIKQRIRSAVEARNRLTALMQ